MLTADLGVMIPARHGFLEGRRSERCWGELRLSLPRYIQFIHSPAQGIVKDVFLDSLQFGRVADDMFVVVTLPDRDTTPTASVMDTPSNRCLK